MLQSVRVAWALWICLLTLLPLVTFTQEEEEDEKSDGPSGKKSTAQSEERGSHDKASTKWRVISLQKSYGWAVGELKLYKDSKCTDLLPVPSDPVTAATRITSLPISSGHSNSPPNRAFDDLTWTEWRAQCYICDPNDAWIGLQFSSPVFVLCMQLFQWGRRDYKTPEAMLQRWDGKWEDVLYGTQLDGDRWDKLHFTKCDELDPPKHGRVEVTNGGYFPSTATYSCAGARVMGGRQNQECQESGEWTGGKPTCWPLLAPILLVVSILLIEVTACSAYYIRIVRKKPPPLEDTTFIPEDQMGKWSTHEIRGVREPPDPDDDPVTNPLWHVLLFPCCRIAETWYSVGQVPFFVGAWIPHLLCPLMPCIGAYFRWQIRSRLLIKGSHFRDCFLWMFCVPCVATQEAKQVDKMCDVAAEEAEVMRQAELRKKEREDKLREAREELAGTRIGRGGEHAAIGAKGGKAQAEPHAKAKPKLAPGTSVMDYLDSTN